MVEDYFGLEKPPFKLSADPSFYVDSESHVKALAYLDYAIDQAEGLVLVTGDSGTGKTMLVHHILDDLEEADILAVPFATGQMKRQDVLPQILNSFGIEAENDGYAAQREAIEEFLYDQADSGKQALLIVDEAQLLSDEVLQELRVLTDIAVEGVPLLQICLVGEKALSARLHQPDLQPVQERIIASCQLENMSRAETASYIHTRMKIAGWEDQEPAFTFKAAIAVYEWSAGNPRAVNRLCARALLQAMVDEQDFVDEGSVEKVIAELAQEGFPPSQHKSDDQQGAGQLKDKITTPPETELDDAAAEFEAELLMENTDHSPTVVESFEEGNVVTLPVSRVDNNESPRLNNSTPSPFNVNETEIAMDDTSDEHGASEKLMTPKLQNTSNVGLFASVLDRFNKSAEPLEASVEGDSQDDILGPTLSELSSDEASLEDIASEISNQLKSDDPDPDESPAEGLDELLTIETGATPDLDELKEELSNFMFNFRGGLKAVTQDIHSIEEQLSKLEKVRTERNSLIASKLIEIEKTLQDIRNG
ncbi:MAG: ExeA family protein [bacterium]